MSTPRHPFLERLQKQLDEITAKHKADINLLENEVGDLTEENMLINEKLTTIDEKLTTIVRNDRMRRSGILIVTSTIGQIEQKIESLGRKHSNQLIKLHDKLDDHMDITKDKIEEIENNIPASPSTRARGLSKKHRRRRTKHRRR
jgi:chromosome segregation ATPase